MLVHYPSEEALAYGAAKLFVEQFQLAVHRSGRFSVLLSGGNTPRRTYELLSISPFKDQVDWSLIDIFWGDERCVDPKDFRSNYLMAYEALLSHVSIPKEQIHPIYCNENPQKSAEDYEALLRKYFVGSSPRFDFVFLGLGVDGHIASLFPQSLALKEKKYWVMSEKKDNDNFARISLTLQVLNLAKVIVVLVTTNEKAQIFKKILSDKKETFLLPAQMIEPVNGKLYWLVDSSALTG